MLQRRKYSIVLAPIIALVCVNCEADKVYLVDVALQPYFDRFVGEAAIRGVEIDYYRNGIEAVISDIDDVDVAGQCRHNSKRPNTVIIDRAYWDSANDLEREFVVFHELGHCVLDRQHLDEASNTGICVSIMNSGTTDCIFIYSSVTRSLYLDELFLQ